MKSMPLWRKIQKENFTSVPRLLDFLELSAPLRQHVLLSSSFPLNLPRRLAAKIVKNTLEDPILRQFVPLQEERRACCGFSEDPLHDTTFRKTSKLLQKYEGRALCITTSACAMHCRFCFRKQFPYETQQDGFAEEIRYLQENPSLSEIILSGGDPLALSDETLLSLFRALEGIPHIRRIRFHTRFPIGIPERIDSSFLRLLSSSAKQLFFVIHCNHPIELDAEVIASLKQIKNLGIPILSQSVLLRGVNDNPEILQQLFEQLVNAGIMPYYLHALDPIEGASHFDLSEAQGCAIFRALQGRLSGLALPRFVREKPGYPSKVLVDISEKTPSQ